MPWLLSLLLTELGLIAGLKESMQMASFCGSSALSTFISRWKQSGQECGTEFEWHISVHFET